MVQVTQFRFFPLMWHRSDMTGERVSRKKTHGFRCSQIGFRPHSYVVINRIWIGYVHLHVPCKQTNRIFPSKCESYVIKKVTSTQVDTTNWDHMTYYRRDGGRRIHTVEQCRGFMSFKSLGRRDGAKMQGCYRNKGLSFFSPPYETNVLLIFLLTFQNIVESKTL